MAETYDYLFKFLIIGDAGSGKSCILHSFIENKFKLGSSHTIGVEFGSKIVRVGNTVVKLQIWDTAGQERFRCGPADAAIPPRRTGALTATVAMPW